jgi:phosphoglycolate phosphatase
LTSKLTVNDVLASVDAVLFDFDGPLCDVFAGIPAWRIANQLQEMIGTHHDTEDPLEVLRLAADYPPEKLHALEDALVAFELTAVKTSIAQDQGVEAIRKSASKGKPTGVVSNNSAKAVASFLDSFNLTKHVHPIIGREYGRPNLMKPNPWPIEQALRDLRVPPSRVAFIGDSMTDIEAAEETGVPCIAYANKSDKKILFRNTSAVVVDSMHEVLHAI